MPTRGRAERNRAHTALAVGGPHHRHPRSGPVEVRRIGDGYETEPALAEPLTPDRPRLRMPLTRDRNSRHVELKDRRQTRSNGSLHASA